MRGWKTERARVCRVHDDDDEIPFVRVLSRLLPFLSFLIRFAISFGRDLRESPVLSPAASSAPLNCPEVSAIEIFMDSRAKLKPISLPPSTP